VGSTLVIVTHSHELAERLDRRFVLRDGCLSPVGVAA